MNISCVVSDNVESKRIRLNYYLYIIKLLLLFDKWKEI